MNHPLIQTMPELIVYPESDGEPIADNSKQFRWIFILYGNLAAQYRELTDVYVGGNMFWYPIEGHPEIVNAPDVFVIFGRPKGDRRSYRQWKEEDVPFTVAFEILSPKNTYVEMDDKFLFYEDYGVEEYYVYDPDKNRLKVYIRRGEILIRVRPVNGFVSPRLGIRFDLTETDLIVTGANGQRFLTFEELQALREQAEQQAEQARQQAEQAEQQAEQARQQAEQAEQQAEQARQQAEQAGLRADQAGLRADQAGLRADQAGLRADQAEQQAEQARLRAEQAEQRLTLLPRFVELTAKARRQQASPEELAELERLEKALAG